MSMLNSSLPGYKYQIELVLEGIKYSGMMFHDSDHGHIGVIVSAHLNGEEAENFSQKKYGRIPAISAVVDGKRKITLFKCRCLKCNYIEFSEDSKTQYLNFSVEYFINSGRYDIQETYDSFQFTVENGMAWSKISQIWVMDNPNGGAPSQVRFRGNDYCKKYLLGGAEIKFRSDLSNFELMREDRKEEISITEHLQITITPHNPAPISYFLSLRDQIVDMISFGIEDNVNILSQSLICGTEEETSKTHFVVTNKKHLPLIHTKPENFNFILDQLPRTKDVSRSLNRLEPILRLYTSFYRYSDMPLEMLFLNATQALETLHGRFYHVPYSKQEDSDEIVHPYKKITLAERITDLLEKGKDQIFAPICNQELCFVERVVLARNYYTHYHESMWQSALDSECLFDIVRILKCILAYHICVQLGVDISDSVKEKISRICLDDNGQPIDLFQT